MEVWITRYVLSKGIIKEECEDCGNGLVKTIGPYPIFYHVEGEDWHRTKESAVKKAEEMRQKEIFRMKKKIKKLEKMKFELQE